MVKVPRVARQGSAFAGKARGGNRCWSSETTRNAASGRKPLAPFGLRAAQAHLPRCPSSPMLWHGLRRFALHLDPRRPQRGPRDFHHGLLKFDAVTVWRVSRVQARSQPALSVSLYG